MTVDDSTPTVATGGFIDTVIGGMSIIDRLKNPNNLDLVSRGVDAGIRAT